MIKAAFAAPLLLLSLPALADTPPVPTLTVPTLTVTAEGHSTRAPDLALFSAGVSTNGATAGDAMAANAAAMTRVIAALKAAGIEPRDIQTSNLNLNPVFDQEQYGVQKRDAPPHIVGYTASNNVTVRQRKLADFGKVIDTLVSAGATQINGPSFQLDNPDAATNEARVNAVANARARAELYAKTAGLKVGRILSISDGLSLTGPFPMALMANKSAARFATPMEAGEQEVTAQVTINFELAGQ